MVSRPNCAPIHRSGALSPARELVAEARTLDAVIAAIKTLAIRGAPAIGVAAAIGLVVSLDHGSQGSEALARQQLPEYAQRLIAARPTAVNLAWAVQRMVRSVTNSAGPLLSTLRAEADAILQEDIAMCAAIGQHGMALVPDGARVLTHCNAGALATAGVGTALAPIYAAHGRGSDGARLRR